MNAISTSGQTLGTEEFASLLLSTPSLIDVRAPVEFSRGHLPGAVNLPLLDDEQRQQVGTRYKQAGKDAAIQLGHELVNDEIKSQRIAAWAAHIAQQPESLLYCFRGGLRSRISQQWLSEAGIEIPRVAGGYKVTRRFFIEQIEAAAAHQSMIIVGGKTGTAKTHLLYELPASIDLEGLACHRGSAFGRRVEAQPTQINFENLLGLELFRHRDAATGQLFVEDEGRAIGSLHIPKEFHEAMGKAPLVMIETSLEQRVDTIWQDYIGSNYREFRAACEESAEQRMRDFLLGSLERISRRLGGERFAAIQDGMNQALTQQFDQGDDSGHRDWIRSLLIDYYDPMYEYQLQKKAHRIVFRGNRDEFLNWASRLDQDSGHA